MAEVLVLVEHVDGAPKKVTYELLTLARSLGEPAAVFIGNGYDNAKDKLAEYGAQKRVIKGVGAGSKPDAIDHLVNNNGLALT